MAGGISFVSILGIYELINKSVHAVIYLFLIARAELSLDDLGDVKEELYKARTKWYDVGLKLKVLMGTLDSIRVQYYDPGDQLCEMLKPWLKGAAKSRPKWEVLVEVLRSPLIEEPNLADHLEGKYCRSEAKSSQGEPFSTQMLLLSTIPIVGNMLLRPDRNRVSKNFNVLTMVFLRNIRMAPAKSSKKEFSHLQLCKLYYVVEFSRSVIIKTKQP